MLGEVLGADRELVSHARRSRCKTASAKPERKVRRSILSAVREQQLLDATEQQVRYQCHQGCGNRAGQDHAVIDHGDAAKDKFTESAGADGSGNGGHANGNDRGDADSRQASPAEPAAIRHATAVGPM